MPRGGPRLGSGRIPSPNALRPASQRSTASDGWTVLPAAGFDGPVPAWPASEASPREAEVWASIWRTPQAVAWAAEGWVEDVALYVRYLVAGQEGSTKAGTEARQWSGILGLNRPGLVRNRWRIAEEAQVTELHSVQSVAPSSRDRFKAN